MKIIKILFSLDFSIPCKTNFIFFGKNSYLNLRDLKVFDNFNPLFLMSEKLNVIILFKTFFKSGFKEIKKNYLKNYIIEIKPSIIVNFTDNYYQFYEMYNFFKQRKIISVSIQNGMRTIVGDIFNLFNKKEKDLGCDYLLTMNDSTGSKYLEFINSENIVIGSIRNNKYKKIENKKKKNIVFISQFNKDIIDNGFLDLKTNKIFSGENFYKAEKIVLEFLVNFCKKNSFKLEIASNGLSKFEDEYNFFSSIVNNKIDFNLIKKEDEYSTYRLCDSSEYTAFIESTIGYESFSRKNKILGFSIRGNFLEQTQGHSFCWPNLKISEGPCWTSKNDVNEFERIGNFILNSDINTWNRIFEQYLNKIMVYDENNLALNNFIKKIKSN